MTENRPVSPYVIEVAAILERALAMAYTGDARVITRQLMAPFGLLQSLVHYGIPSFVPAISFDSHISTQFHLHPDHWPTDNSGLPAVSSKRAQCLTYGDAHFYVCRRPLLSVSLSHL